MLHYKKNKAVTHEICNAYAEKKDNVILTGLGLSLLPGSVVEVTVKNGEREIFNDVVVNDRVTNIVPITFKENVAQDSIRRVKFTVTMKGFGAMYPFRSVPKDQTDGGEDDGWRDVKTKDTSGEPIGEVTFRIYDRDHGQIPELYFYVEKRE